jgi:hypothetical protein
MNIGEMPITLMNFIVKSKFYLINLSPNAKLFYSVYCIME